MHRKDDIIHDLQRRLQYTYATIYKLKQERAEITRRFDEMCKTVASRAAHQTLMVVNDPDQIIANLYKQRDEAIREHSEVDLERIHLQAELTKVNESLERQKNLNSDMFSTLTHLQRDLDVWKPRAKKAEAQRANLKDELDVALSALEVATKERDSWRDQFNNAVSATPYMVQFNNAVTATPYTVQFTHARQLQDKVSALKSDRSRLQAELDKAKADNDELLNKALDLQRKNTHLELDLSEKRFEQETIKQGIFNSSTTKENSNADSNQPRHDSFIRSERINGTGARTAEWTADAINVRIESASDSHTFRKLERAVTDTLYRLRSSSADHRQWHEFRNDSQRQAEVDQKSKSKNGGNNWKWW